MSAGDWAAGTIDDEIMPALRRLDERVKGLEMRMARLEKLLAGKQNSRQGEKK